MEPNDFGGANVFAYRLCSADKECLAAAQNGAQAFSGYKARREALKARKAAEYLTLRENALHYHGFTKEQGDYFYPGLRYYLMAFPPTSLEVAALRTMEERLVPDPAWQALRLVVQYLPRALPFAVEGSEGNGLESVFGQEARNIWLDKRKADLDKLEQQGSLDAARINSLYQSDMAGLAAKNDELADIKRTQTITSAGEAVDTARQQTERQDAAKNDVFKAWLVNGAEFTGKYELPRLKPCYKTVNRAIPFDKALKTGDKNQWLHFFIDDRRFECVWNNPKAYLAGLKAFDGVISTDFSLYFDMPLAMQIWNTYRNRALAFWLQQNGVEVIPNVQWGDARSYEFCFDGLPQNSTVAISTHGCIQGKEERLCFKQGLEELIKRLAPRVIVNYSNMPDDLFLPYKNAGIEMIQIPNWHDVVRKRGVE